MIQEWRTKLNQLIRGGMNYFTQADAKSLIKRLDYWLRSCIRIMKW
ncbi:group II intron maturase-specific domain-containing protein [Rubeoparvulum massiliense]